MAPADGTLRIETLLWGGDDLLWVVPAWKGIETLVHFFGFREREGCRSGTFRERPLRMRRESSSAIGMRRSTGFDAWPRNWPDSRRRGWPGIRTSLLMRCSNRSTMPGPIWIGIGCAGSVGLGRTGGTEEGIRQGIDPPGRRSARDRRAHAASSRGSFRASSFTGSSRESLDESGGWGEDCPRGRRESLTRGFAWSYRNCDTASGQLHSLDPPSRVVGLLSLRRGPGDVPCYLDSHL